MALVPTFLFDFESEMARITEFEFARIIAAGNLWWRDIAKVRPTGKKREIIGWLISNAQLYDAGKSGGNMQFDDIAAITQEYDVRNVSSGLKLQKNQMTDNDGDGFDFAGEWSANEGALFGYWPQALIATLWLNGAMSASLAYDNVPFFTKQSSGNPHPYNPKNTPLGGFYNWITGAGGGGVPAALPIDESVSLDTAFKNLGILFGYIASIKMPNGTTPKFLRARRLCVAPRLMPRAQQLSNAKYIAQAASSGGGSGDVEAIVNNWGLEQPLEIQEFAGATTGDGVSADLVYYIECVEMRTTQLGSMVYVDREPFKITYYTGDGGGTGQDAVLDRARELEWHSQGRNIAGYGHPYGLFRCDPT